MNLQFRKAQRTDVPEIVRLLSDDKLGKSREGDYVNIASSYYSAFDAIDSDQNNYLLIAELNGTIVGTMQLTFITHMTYQGGKRMQIEGVRVDEKVRGQGIGKAMFTWAIHKAKESGCHLVQLTTDKKRPDALKFYQSIGFVASHEGLKMYV